MVGSASGPVAKSPSGYRGLVPLLTVIFIAVLPFYIGPTLRYAFSIIIMGVAIREMASLKGPEIQAGLKGFLHIPLIILVLFLLLTAFSGVVFSPDVLSSLKGFFSDFFLNIGLFLVLSLYFVFFPFKTGWIRSLKWVNLFFVVTYLGILIQWILFPSHPFLSDEYPHYVGVNPFDIFFLYGDASGLFNGIKHLSLYMLFLISFSFVNVIVSKGRDRSFYLLLFFLNLIVLFSTSKRSAMVAVILGMLAISLLVRSSRKYVAVALLFIILLFSVLSITGHQGHFIRENWDLIAHGKLEKAKEQGGSIPLRVYTYREFIKEIVKSPFKPRGLGRDLIKRYHKDLIQRAGLDHAHNVFINFAFQFGIQGAILLLAVLVVQLYLYVKDYLSEHDQDAKILMLASSSYIFMFWIANLFTDGYCHDSATLYWLASAFPTGHILARRLSPTVTPT